MDNYSATYYTGLSSQGYKATVKLQDDKVFIAYQNERGWNEGVQWEYKNIKKQSTAEEATTYQYGTYPSQTICTNDVALIKLLDQDNYVLENHYFKLIHGGWSLRIGVVLFLLGLLATLYLFVIPGTAAFLAGQLPQSVEVELGQQLYASVLRDHEKDEHLSRLANDFSRELAFDTDYPIEITVIKHYEHNAFAMPGGHIVIYDALLHELESPEAFAALLGHEVAHVKYRHSLKSISRALSSYLFVSFVLSDLNGITAVLVENASMLSRLSYSRELEKTADEEALAILAINRLDQQGLVQLMETLEKNEYLSTPELLSSHPLTQDRIPAARQQVKSDIAIKEHKVLVEIWRQIKETK